MTATARCPGTNYFTVIGDTVNLAFFESIAVADQIVLRSDLADRLSSQYAFEQLGKRKIKRTQVELVVVSESRKAEKRRFFPEKPSASGVPHHWLLVLEVHPPQTVRCSARAWCLLLDAPPASVTCRGHPTATRLDLRHFALNSD